jgi:hypothetical protein
MISERTGIAPGAHNNHKYEWKRRYHDKCKMTGMEDQNVATAGQV